MLYHGRSSYLLTTCCMAIALLCQAHSQCQPKALAGDHRAASNLEIGPGDMLDVSVFDVPELILKVRVGEDGAVDLPLVGSMRWAGLSVNEAQERLAAKLVQNDYVKVPQVSILITEFATQSVSVGGEVNQPGIYPLPGPHTLFDAISAAGGFTANAGGTITVLHKCDPSKPDKISIASNGTFQNPQSDIQPGDMITVSKAGIVYVVGEVNKPGGFVMGNNSDLTVVKAIALAQGPTNHAKMNRASIVRYKGGRGEVINVDIKQMMRGREWDFPLQPDDIVYVPNSAVRTTADIMEKASIGAAAATVLVIGHYD